MTSAQLPIGSGFDAKSTVDDVLQGHDLTGRTAIVTGGYSGVGLADVRALSAAGASIVVPARRPDTAASELAGVPGVEVAELDLGDLDSIAAFCDAFLATGRSIDLLVAAAGIMATPETRVGTGWEAQFAVNHLGHFALTNRLWPALTANGGARVVVLSSRGHKFSDIRWSDLHFSTGYDRWQAYGQSKTANVLFARRLDTLGEPFGVRAFAVNPGGIKTNLQRHVTPQDQLDLGWVDEEGRDLITWKTPEQGAATAAWAATATRLDDMGGIYLEDCEVARVSDPGSPDAMKFGVHPYAINPDSAARLWRISADLTGVDAFTKTPVRD